MTKPVMTFRRTSAINRIRSMKRRYKIIQGGTNAGKTYAIIPIIIDYAIRNPHRNITVVAQTVPALKAGALKIFLDLMQELNRFHPKQYNATDRKYTFYNGTTITFTTFDSVGKAKQAGKRTDLFINEANYIPWPIADALMGRTTGNIWIDFNPDSEFWAHTELLNRPDAEFLLLTYLDNEALPETALEDLMIKKEKAKTSPYWANWWRVYGEGQIGQLQGACFPNIKEIDSIPKNAELLGYGMDFGYKNDPTTIIAAYKLGNTLFFDELLYETGLSNRRIREKAERLGIHMGMHTIADNDEKSIDELKGIGNGVYWSIKPAHKPPGSIKYGITLINDFEICVTRRSVNMLTESRKLIWDVDKNGKELNEPKKGNDHAWDAARYICSYKISRRRLNY